MTENVLSDVISNTWILKTTFLKLNGNMFRCIQTTSSGQEVK